jgi:hypothetical protein
MDTWLSASHLQPLNGYWLSGLLPTKNPAGFFFFPRLGRKWVETVELRNIGTVLRSVVNALSRNNILVIGRIVAISRL